MDAILDQNGSPLLDEGNNSILDASGGTVPGSMGNYLVTIDAVVDFGRGRGRTKPPRASQKAKGESSWSRRLRERDWY